MVYNVLRDPASLVTFATRSNSLRAVDNPSFTRQLNHCRTRNESFLIVYPFSRCGTDFIHLSLRSNSSHPLVLLLDLRFHATSTAPTPRNCPQPLKSLFSNYRRSSLHGRPNKPATSSTPAPDRTNNPDARARGQSAAMAAAARSHRPR